MEGLAHGHMASHQIRSQRIGGKRTNSCAWPHGAQTYAQGPGDKGFLPNINQFWVFKHYNKDFIGFFSSFEKFWPILGDLGPFFRPNLREKLRGCYPPQVYIKKRLLKPWREFQNRKMMKNC